MTLKNGAKFLQVMVGVSDLSGTGFYINTSTLAIRTLVTYQGQDSGRSPSSLCTSKQRWELPWTRGVTMPFSQ